MKKLGVLILLMLAAGPVAAQDDAAMTQDAEENIVFGVADEATAEPAASAEPTAAAEATAAATDAGADAAAASGEAPMEPAADASADTAAGATGDAAADTAADATEATGDASDATADAMADTSAEFGAEAAVVEDTVAVEESAETAEFTEESSASMASGSADESEPWELYVGTDYVSTRAQFSDNDLITEFGGDDFDSSMIRARVGMRLFRKIGVEVHLGAGNDDVGDLDADEYSTEEFYGAYLVPTGVLFDLIEVGAAIGVAHTKLETATASETLSGVSFGVNIEVPLYSSEAVELRVGGGGTMFRAQNSAQISGYHAGIRVDFRI